MSYTIQAIIGPVGVLAALHEPNVMVVAIPQGFGMIPLTESLRRDLGIPLLPFTGQESTVIPHPLEVLIKKVSKGGTLAYIEAEFFGGLGTQASFVVKQERFEQRLVVGRDAINNALRCLGVTKGGACDEFDALKLGENRCTDDWIGLNSQRCPVTAGTSPAHAQSSKVSLVRALLSPKAIACHILCIALLIAFISDLLSGQTTRPKSELIRGIIAIGVAYPLVLILIWLQHYLERREVENEMKNPTAASIKRNQRKRWRRLSVVYIICVGVALIYAGYRGWKIDFLPAQYIGFLLLAFGVLGTFGVNIWYKGPIDPRFDPQDGDAKEQEGSA
ncbi:MAG TPA: hypothetical protein VMX13_13995 [Sedimentisphaerales bacterium]|nr:hypothetical protein [Sedimentisphaerales bacterium]